jgi:hypothetical protein
MTPTPHDPTCYGPIASVSQYQLLPITGNVGIMQIDMAAGGAYSFPPTVTITGGSGSGAQAHAILKNPEVTAAVNNPVAFVYIDNPGSGYQWSDQPVVNFSTSSGSGAVAHITPPPNGQGIATIAPIQLPLFSVDYSFTRKTTWATRVRRYQDQSSMELMPYQAVAMYEFTIHTERWTVNDLNTLENVVDQVKGSGYPMWITAPDDGQIYNVRFKEDLNYSVPGAVTRTGDLVLVTIGDSDNSIDNSQAYPPPVLRRKRTYVPGVL